MAVTTRSQSRASRYLLVSDFVGLAVAALIGPLATIAILSSRSSQKHLGDVYVFNMAVIPMFLILFSLYGLYRSLNRRISMRVIFDLSGIFHAILIGGVLYAIASFVASREFGFHDVSGAQVIAMCLAALITVPLARLTITTVLGRQTLAKSVSVIVVGTGKVAQTTASHLRANSNVDFVGFVDDKPLTETGVVGNLEDLPELCRTHGVSRVVVCFSKTHPEHLTDILKQLSGRVAVSIVPRYYELITSRTHVDDLSGITMLDVPPTSMGSGAQFMKRSFDILVTSLILLVISPLVAVIAVIIKLTSSGPVFFRQVRVGGNEETFSMLKFRTMYRDAEGTRRELEHLNEADGPLFKIRNDPRVTSLGRFLRKTSLDEIPQLINVWRGDMSLVGPRPFIESESMMIEGWARKRFDARPGMTGLWQVSGRNELSHLEMARLDYLYVASWSFRWDIYILWQTPAAVFRGRGAS
ncbi:MAG: sugar transferase [Acidimicrobiales bacterium]